MNAINLGPLALPTGPLLLVGALLAGSAAARWSNRQRKADVEPALWRVLIAGVLVARLAFVGAYLDAYSSAPWKILDIRDGGFVASAGFLAALVLAAWLVYRSREARTPLLAGTIAGALFWMGGLAVMSMMQDEPMQLPGLSLTRLDGTAVQMQSLAGKPLVVNLWATWCPPCRREMPVLQDAQMRHRDVVFVFVNQGESADTVRKYLASEGLALDNVLLDPGLAAGRETGSRALPTTLFFNTDGALADRRMGELSSATLAQRLDALRKVRQRQPALQRP